MLQRNLAFALALGLGISCVACGSSDADNENNAGGAAGSAGQTGEDSGAPDQQLPAEPVSFTDANLELCVRNALQMADGDLYPEHLAMLDHLECQDMGITNVVGLEHATSMVELSLFENAIVDLTPLQGLTQLRDLRLDNNEIQDTSALSGLTSLRRLGLAINQISSLEPLATLTSLEWLNLDNNAFGESELVHLAGLTNLRWLTIEHNGIDDESALQPVVDAGCDVYAHRAPVTAEATRFMVPSAIPMNRPKVRLSDLRSRIDAQGRVAFGYQLEGKDVPVRLVSGPLLRDGDQVVRQMSDENVSVGDIVDGKPRLCQGEHAKACRVRLGVKWPEAGRKLCKDDRLPIVTLGVEMIQASGTKLMDGEAWFAADNDLEPLALAAPNQLDAGSCLFMATTGAMEILMNQHVAPEEIEYNGDTDLSERFLMAAGSHAPYSTAPWFLTDTLEYYGAIGGSLLNLDYKFCVGYVKDTASGYTQSTSSDPDAYLSCAYNWFDNYPEDWESKLVETPAVERTIIFADPKRDDNSQWRVALFDGDTIEKIKYELRTKNAPVIVVYNHFGYWHANVIVGYDDTEKSGGCGIVRDTVQYFNEQGGGYTYYAKQISDKVNEDGGCSLNGVFYVRDSIYEGSDEEPEYDYSTADATISGYRYSERIIKLSYNWAQYLANHAYSVHRK